MSRGGTADSPAGREPSWTTAVSEAGAASRQLRQAAASLERASRELQALREWSDTTARLELARSLTQGADGGVLGALVGAAREASSGASAHAIEALLDRLAASLGLEPVGERGERLRLLPDELGEFELRGEPAAISGDETACYRVVRPGWLLGGLVVTRPLVEAE